MRIKKAVRKINVDMLNVYKQFGKKLKIVLDVEESMWNNCLLKIKFSC